MNRRRKNNIVIGTLCAVLVLMGVGYAILNTTLNIGGTANIKGDFDIHFTRIQRSSSTITDSTLLSTMDNGTGITDGTNNHEGTFTAVLQKPTDYVIYDIVVANTGSIDGYLTFTFGDTNSNFNYYKDFYSVEFIRDDVDPEIRADILQPNATFTDSEVLENTTGTRTYKIKVTFKESATSFPDATTNGDFECSLNLTYSQQAPEANSGGNSDQSGVTTYTGTYTNPDDSEMTGTRLSMTLQDEQNGTKSIVHFMIGEQDMAESMPEGGFKLLPYDSNVTFTSNYLGITPTIGDYVLVMDNSLGMVLHNNVIYLKMEDKASEPVQQLIKETTAQPTESMAGTYTGTYENMQIVMVIDENRNVTSLTLDGNSNLPSGSRFEEFDSNIDYSQYVGYSSYTPEVGVGDYVMVVNTSLAAVYRNGSPYLLMDPGSQALQLTRQ